MVHKDPQAELIGFLKGPGGIINNNFKKLTAETISYFRNRGGFDMICKSDIV